MRAVACNIHSRGGVQSFVFVENEDIKASNRAQ